MENRFSNWKYPDIKDGEPTKYNWIVQNLDGLDLGFETDIGAFSYINLNPKPHFPSVHSCVILSKNSSINYLKSS